MTFRWRWALISLTALGCVTSAPSRQVALVPLAAPPPAFRGVSGLGLAAGVALGRPSTQGDGDAVATPRIQTELSNVIRISDAWSLMVDLFFAPAAGALRTRSSLPPLSGAAAFGGHTGLGYDIHAWRSGGISVAGELGFSAIAMTVLVGGFASSGSLLMFSGRLGAAPYFTVRQWRFFAGASIGTGAWSDETGVVTTTCNLFCYSSTTARTELSSMVIIGGGTRFQPSPLISFSAEIWVPVVGEHVRQPPQFVLSIQFGDFTFPRPSAPVEKLGPQIDPSRSPEDERPLPPTVPPQSSPGIPPPL